MIPFFNLSEQQKSIKSQIDKSIQNVLKHGQYIMGPEVNELESNLSLFVNSKNVISCASGTDALLIYLLSKKLKKNDAILVPSFSFISTAEVVVLAGATPIFVDIDISTFNIDCESLKKAIKKIPKKYSLRGIISVDLFGQPADYENIEKIAKKNNLWILVDAAQSFGATYKNKKVGKFGEATATSFFPSKPLGCYGDGGAIFTDDDDLAETLRSIRVHGKGNNKYDNIRVGLNSRLDTIQAAILIEKLKIFPKEIKSRQEVASMYNNALNEVVKIPKIIPKAKSTWAQYTVRLDKKINRFELISDLKSKGIPSMVYYQKPCHLQKGYKNFPTTNNESLKNSEVASATVLSLPMINYTKKKEVKKIIEQIFRIISFHIKNK